MISEEKSPVVITSLANQEALRPVIAEIFVNAYYESLLSISTDKKRLMKAFKASFILDRFYGAFVDATLVGIFALTDSNGRCFRLVKADFIKQFGFFKGSIIYNILKKEFEHSITLRQEGYNIEAVATSPDYQGKGIATKMMKYAIDNFNYLELDVIDTNSVAINLYKKLGFTVWKEIPVRFFRSLAGFNKRLFLYYKR